MVLSSSLAIAAFERYDDMIIHGNTQLDKNLNIDGNVTNGRCGDNFAYVVADSAQHSSGQHWNVGEVQSNLGVPFLCDGFITGMILSYDLPPSATNEKVHIELNNVDKACSVTVSPTSGVNQVIRNSTCNVRFKANTTVIIAGDFATGNSVKDGIVSISGRWTYD